jgi:hypothetical protein
VRFGVMPGIAGPLMADASLEFCFPSVLAGHAALSGAATRFRRSRPTLLWAVFRYASATRIRLERRSLTAQLKDFSRFAFAAAASHASPPFF